MDDLKMLDITSAKDFDEALTRVCLAVEADGEEKGWETEDSGAFNTWLGVLYCQMSTEADGRLGPLWITELPRPDHVPHLPTLLEFLTQRDVLTMLAKAIWANVQDNAAPIGIVASFEGWGVKANAETGFTPEEQRAADNHEIHLLANKIEFRHTVLCLFDGRTVHADRQRGEEPEARILEKDSADRRGKVPTYLRRLTKGILGPIWMGD